MSLVGIIPSSVHVRTVASEIVGILPNIEAKDTSSPAMHHRPSNQLRSICEDGPT